MVVQLAPHFQLHEFTRSSTGLPNEPGPEEIAALRALCSALLVPLRQQFGRIRITSGFRSTEVNAELARRGYGVAKRSQHLRGEAADFFPVDAEIDLVWRRIVSMGHDGWPIDQAIRYENHIHISHSARHPPRREIFTL